MHRAHLGSLGVAHALRTRLCGGHLHAQILHGCLPYHPVACSAQTMLAAWLTELSGVLRCGDPWYRRPRTPAGCLDLLHSAAAATTQL
jgi:hypothetical protein